MKTLLCGLTLLLSLAACGQQAEQEQACIAPQPQAAPASPQQSQSLADFAYQIAREDGHKQPKYLVGVIKVESSAGKASRYRVVKQGLGKEASTFYGAAQLTLGAAKAVMARFPALWVGFDTKTDEELKARLILDDRFNVRVASKYLLIMGVNKDVDRGIAAYNVGLGGVELIDAASHEYTLKVKYAAGS